MGVGVGVATASTLIVMSAVLLDRNASLTKKLMLPVPTNPVYGVKITSMVVAVSELLGNEVQKLGLITLCYRGLHE